MKHCFHTLIIALVALVAACSSQTDVPQIITDAEQLAGAGKYTDAIAMCDRLVTTSDSSLLTATQLCRIGVLYAVAADNDIDNDTNTARAMHSFIRAYAINRDSVAAYVDNLNIERLPAVRTVLQLMGNQDEDPATFENIDELEDLDSIYTDEQ